MGRVLEILRVNGKVGSALLALLVLTSCGGGGGSSTSLGPQTPAVSVQAAEADIVVAKIDSATVPIFAVIADKKWHERIVLVGEKNADGDPLRLTEIQYSNLGKKITVELNSEGLPSLVSDELGNKYSLQNYANGLAEITIFDSNGGITFGPQTIQMDLSAAKRAISKDVPLARIQASLPVNFSKISPHIDTAGVLLDLAVCGASLATLPVAIPTVGASLPLTSILTLTTCGKAALSSLTLVTNYEKNPLNIAYESVDGASFAFNLFTGDAKGLTQDAASYALKFTKYAFDAKTPELPIGLAASPTSTSIRLAWNISSNDANLKGFKIKRNDNVEYFVSTTNYEDSNITLGKQYCYQVTALKTIFDNFGVEGQLESEKTTAACATIPTSFPPLVKTHAPTNQTPSTATINGSVTPNSVSTDAYFEYGISSAYGHKSNAVSVGNGAGAVPYSVTISALSPNVVYHYRIVAVNAAGQTSYGSNQTFRAITPITPNPTITGVTGAVASNIAQLFTINGNNFYSNANITLRNKNTGEIYPFRTPSSLTSTQIKLSVVFSSNPAQWSVNVVNPDSASSGEFVFNLEADSTFITTAPTLVSPANNSAGQTVEPTLRWSGGSAKYWRVNITNTTTNALFLSPTLQAAQLSYVVPGGVLAAGAQYRWSVTACPDVLCNNSAAFRSSGNFLFSTASAVANAGSLPGNFTLSNQPPIWDARVTPTLPAGPAVTLSWSSSSAASGYEVYRGGVKVFPANSGLHTGTTFTNESGMVGGQTYTFYILAKNGNGSKQSNSITVGPMPSAPPPAAVTPGIGSLSFASTTADGVPRTLTVSGTNFVSGNVVAYRWLNPVGSSISAVTVTSASQLSVSFNPGTVTDTIFVKVCQSAGSLNCSAEQSIAVTAPAVAAPGISSLSLTSVVADGVGRTLTINGSNFSTGNVVIYRWLNPVGSSVTTATIASASQLSVSFNPGTVTDTIFVKVCKASSSAVCSAEQSISVVAPVVIPGISSLSFTTVTADGAARTLTVTGSNFASGNVVNFRWLNPVGNSIATATVASASQLSVPFNPGTVTDTIFVKVCKTSGSTSCSSEQSISVTAPVVSNPSISSLSFTSVPADGASRTLTINGGNFGSGNVVNFRWLNPVGSSVTAATISSASQLSVPFNPGTVADTIFVKICKASGSTACSSELSISVTAIAPVLGSISPNPVPKLAASQTVTISGSNFVNGATVTLVDIGHGGTFSKAATFVNSGRLTISANFTATASLWSATVVNPNGQKSGTLNFNVQ